MADGGNGGAAGGGRPLHFWRQQKSHLHCPDVLGLGYCCSSKQILLSSVAQLTRKTHKDSDHTIVIIVMQLSLEQGRNSLSSSPFGIPIVAHFNSLNRVVQKPIP